jgi:hypothetical protein
MTVVIPFRLNLVEVEGLDKMVSGSGAENRSEFLRLLLHREINRRSGLPKPKASDFQSAFRIGRPGWGSDRWSAGRLRNTQNAGEMRNTLSTGQKISSRVKQPARVVSVKGSNEQRKVNHVKDARKRR